MAVTVELNATGFEDIINSWNEFDGNIDENIKDGIDESFFDIANAMRSNVTSMFNKGYATGVMLNSVSHKVTIDKNGEGVFGTVGVYDMSRKTGSVDRKINAPVLAFFYETGIRPHSLAKGVRLEQPPTPSQPNGRAAKGVQVDPIHPGSPPIPFLSNAFDSRSQTITPTMIGNMEREINKL